MSSQMICANPTIREALEAVRKDLVSSPSSTSKLDRLDQCLESLERYPLPLDRPSHCLILQGFNKDVVRLVSQKLDSMTEISTGNSQALLNLSLSPIQKRLKTVDSKKMSAAASKAVDSKKNCAVASKAVDSKKNCAVASKAVDSKKNCAVASKAVDSKKNCAVASKTVAPKKLRMPSQEDTDFELAQKLDYELNGDNSQGQEEEDYKLALRLNQKNSKYTQVAQVDTETKKVSDDFNWTEEEPDCSLTTKKTDHLLAQRRGFRRLEEYLGSDTEEQPNPLIIGQTPDGEAGSPGRPPRSPSPVPSTSTWRRARRIAGAHDLSDSVIGDDDVGGDLEAGVVGGDFGDGIESTAPTTAHRVNAVHALSESDGDTQEETRTKLTNGQVANGKKLEKKKPAIKEPPKRLKKRREPTKVVVDAETELPQWAKEALQGTEDRLVPVQDNSPEFYLRAHDFDVLLLVDTQEVTGGNQGGKVCRKRITNQELDAQKVNFEVRHLNVGDFAWVARDRLSKKELMLPYVVERKRMDDLRASIIDGRYKEQKWRLSRCGIRHAIYLVEEFTKHKKRWGGNSEATVKSMEAAIANTLVTNGFTVKYTDGQRDTVSYLAKVTSLLEEKFCRLRLRSCTKADIDQGLVQCSDNTLLTFPEFYDNSKKSPELSVSQVFSRMLMEQHGVTQPMAEAVTTRFPTLGSLIRAYRDSCYSDEERENLLVGMTYDGHKKIRPAVSKVIAWLYNDEHLQ